MTRIRPIEYRGVFVEFKGWALNPNWELFKAHMVDTAMCLLVVAAFIMMIIALVTGVKGLYFPGA